MSEQDDFLRAKAERIKQRYGPQPPAPDSPKSKITEEQGEILNAFKKELCKRIFIGSGPAESLPPLEETEVYKRLLNSGIEFRTPPQKDPGIIVDYEKLINEISPPTPKRNVQDLESIGNVDPVCPYCNAIFPKKPKAKTKCKVCGNFVYVRSRPPHNWKVLVTKEQADLMQELLEIKNGTYFDKRQVMANHLSRYQEANYGGWIFHGVLDERSPVEEVELHGKIIKRGSPNERLALEVMFRSDCRGRPGAWFNDPKLDTPEEQYAWFRYDWAIKALETLPESERWSEKAQRINAIIARYKKATKTND